MNRLIIIVVSDEILLKDSELQNQMNAMDDEEKKLLDDELKVMEELKVISEKHRNMTSVFDKVVNNLELMVKKKLKNHSPTKESTIDDLQSKEKEEPVYSETLITDYEAFLLVVTDKLNEITTANSKSEFEGALKQKGYMEYGKSLRTDRLSIRGTGNLDKTREASKIINSSLEYIFDDPDVKNEDKTIQDETDKLIEENKLAINKRREEIKEGLKDRKK